VITTLLALTSAVKELTPTPRQNLAAFFNEVPDTTDFAFTKASASLQSQRSKPKLRHVVIALNVNVLWLIPVAGVKEESIRSFSQYRRHVGTILPHHKNSPDFGSLPV
jgi:hypothetical protein